MPPSKTPRLAGAVQTILPSEPDFQAHVATVAVDVGYKRGVLIRVPMTEAKLAEVVATGAAILARLAKERG